MDPTGTAGRDDNLPRELAARRHVYGVDFSGARDAGRLIWIAGGVIDGNVLRIERCQPAAELPGGGVARERALTALRDFVAAARDAAFGFDFPFGLPATLVTQPTWADFAGRFARDYPDADTFRHACVTASGGRELRRQTDDVAKTPFSPYNLRLYRQTYTGIRDLLAPLADDDAASVVPMQVAHPGRPWLLEVCPASTLKRAGHYIPYKGRTAAHRAARECILEVLGTMASVEIPPAVQQLASVDTGGDALDSLIAAVTTFRVVTNPSFPGRCTERERLEGRVYV